MAITNLTNTKWYLNDTLEPMGEYIESGWFGPGYSTHYTINFTANDVAFCELGCEFFESPASGASDRIGELQYKYVSPEGADPCEIPYDYLNSRWYGYAEPYRTIVITGGDDATNPDLIAWLEANATQLDVEDPGTSPDTPDEDRTPAFTFDLSTLDLAAGTYTIYSTLSAEGYKNSEPSNEVTYEVAEVGYLTFSSPNSFTLATNNAKKNWDGTLEYSTDTSTWNVWDGTTTLSADNGKLYLRGTNNTKISPELESLNTYCWVLSGMHIACNGNIETLLDYMTVTNGQHPPMADHCFVHLFSDCTSLIAAPTLPAISLSNYCYDSMFYNCTNLIEAPALPATTLAQYCYSCMFEGCTSLIKAPTLPATTLASSCYVCMFRYCTNLIEVPALPATTLTNSCYMRMFEGCTNLEKIPALPATTLVSSCYGKMFYNCTKIKLSTTQTAEYCNEYRLPISGDGTTTSEYVVIDMFANTGGTFAGEPTINTTYYTSNTIIY